MGYCKAHQLDMRGFCGKFDCPCIKHNCRFFGVKTNADLFSAMPDDEQQKCVRRFWEIEDFADWLKQPAEE